MEYSPPPLFKQGAPARVKLAVFALISLALLISDARFGTLTVMRKIIATALYPLQTVALMPRDAANGIVDFFSLNTTLQNQVKQLKHQQITNAQLLQQAQQFASENAHLRQLLESRSRVPVKSLMSEILYDTKDAFTHKVIIDRGTQHGVVPGQPVIDEIGVVGQITRAFPLTSEVTLLTDKDQAIPIQVVRNGLRSVAYGRGQSGLLDLRFIAANADVQVGDVLVTSGIDGVYPAGLSVAKVVRVENNMAGVFGRIVCQSMAGMDRHRQLLILLTDMHVLPNPIEEEKRSQQNSSNQASKKSQKSSK